MSKVMPFRDNPLIVANWFNRENSENQPDVGKKSYYDISVQEGKLRVQFREEKQKTEEASVESPWHSWLEFPLDSQFAKDLLEFLAENVEIDEKGEAEVFEAKGKTEAK